MSQYRCHACDVPITSLTSQKNGNLDTCLNCAIEHAAFVRYILKRRDQVLHDDVVCQRHYQADSQPGHYMQPLTKAEEGAGYQRIVTPYQGERTCEQCDEIAETKKGTAA